MRPPWLPSTWAHPALVHGPRSAVHSFTVRGGMAVSKETPSPDGSPKAAADDGAPAVDPAAALPSLVKMAPGILKLRSEDVHAHCLPLDIMVLSALLYVFISGLWVFPSKSALDSIILMRRSIFQLVPYQPRAIRSAPCRVHERAVPPIGDLHMCLGWLRPFDFQLLATRSQDRRVDQRAICQLLGQFWCLLYPPLTFLSWQDLQHVPF